MTTERAGSPRKLCCYPKYGAIHSMEFAFVILTVANHLLAILSFAITVTIIIFHTATRERTDKESAVQNLCVLLLIYGTAGR